ncbi:hypothetical protein [Paenibacillus periandrae]|uniref:hypothetical protein n=1 Tax=Paenibacillus periandrae TaxID=1761741 RepID=UPI001F0933A6|nr:hypothetical protein [Paenibacillus periandrae]
MKKEKGNNLFFEINNKNELFVQSHIIETKFQTPVTILSKPDKHELSEQPKTNVIKWMPDFSEKDIRIPSYSSFNVQEHANEIRCEQLNIGDYFFVSWTSSISPFQYVDIKQNKVGSDYIIGEIGPAIEQRSFLRHERVVKLEKRDFNVHKPPLEMTNSEALQTVFHFILQNTLGLKEAITSAGKVKAIGILKNAVKRGYGAFTEGLFFAIKQENGPDHKVQFYVGKQGNNFPFKITNYRDLLGRYFYGDLTVPDVAPPEKEKVLISLHEPVVVLLKDRQEIRMKYLGNMGTNIWGRSKEGNLITIPKCNVDKVTNTTNGNSP